MSTEPITVRIDAHGELVFIYADGHPLAALAQDGHAHTARASHVEPVPGGGWQADMGPVGGPCLPPTQTRAESLRLETEYLRAQVLSPGPDRDPLGDQFLT
jgi:hypothetical protein